MCLNPASTWVYPSIQFIPQVNIQANQPTIKLELNQTLFSHNWIKSQIPDLRIHHWQQEVKETALETKFCEGEEPVNKSTTFLDHSVIVLCKVSGLVVVLSSRQ